MDEAGIEARGLAPLQPSLDKVAAIADAAGLSRYLGGQVRADTDPLNATNFYTENLFGLFVAQGLEDPSKNVGYLMQGGLGMPDRDFYLNPAPRMVAIRAAYKTYIGELLKLAGVADPLAAALSYVGQGAAAGVLSLGAVGVLAGSLTQLAGNAEARLLTERAQDYHRALRALGGDAGLFAVALESRDGQQLQTVLDLQRAR